MEECERHIHRKCENTTEYRQNTASRSYSLRIHTEYGGLQNTTQEYRAEPRRIRKRIPYSSSYSEYGKEYGIFHAEYRRQLRLLRLLRLRGPVGGSSMKVTVHASVSTGLPSSSKGGGTTVASTFYASGAFFSSALLSFLLSTSVDMPAPLPSSFCFPAALVVFFFSCRQWEVGVRERRSHMKSHMRQGGHYEYSVSILYTFTRILFCKYSMSILQVF